MTIRFAHFSDSHLDYEAYPNRSASGNNQRGEDVVRAFVNTCADIGSWSADIIIHSGDLGERPKIGVRSMLVAQQQFARLAGIREDGLRAPVFVIAGNHDLPRSRKEACWLNLLNSLDGVFVVTDVYRPIRIDAERDRCSPDLDGVVVHMLPHDALKEVDFDIVRPDPAATANILVAHGVAAGSELFTRNLGREYAIDTDVLGRDWDYVALGHYHKRGPVAAGKRGGIDRAWYAGSAENISFRDLKANDTPRGYLRGEIGVGEESGSLVVEEVDLPIRLMKRLPVLEAAGMSVEEIEEGLITRVNDGVADGAVIGQIVEGVSRDMWSLVDIAKVRETAGRALHYEVTVRYGKVEREEGEGGGVVGDLGVVLDEVVASRVPEDLRADVLDMAKSLLGTALSGPLEENDTGAGGADGGSAAGENAPEREAELVLEAGGES